MGRNAAKAARISAARATDFSPISSFYSLIFLRVNI